jgi:hypothetical protein
LHIAVFLIAYFGVPHVMRETGVLSPPIPVEVVPITEKTRAPRPEPQAKPEPEQKPEPKPAPQPKPQPLAAPEPLPVPNPPEPKLKPEPKPEPKKPEPKPEPEKVSPKVEKSEPKKPEPKKTEASDFQSVLKTVERLRKSTPAPTPPAETPAPEQPQSLAMVEPASRLTISEEDAVRQRIAQCWNIPAGARDAENLVVDIRLVMLPDGRVAKAEIVDKARMERDPFFRVAAESALRAVLNPKCSPLPLPPEKYEIWRNMTLAFNPKEMFGT